MNITLELDHDSVRLLKRTGKGRTEVGALRLDDPDFDRRIVALRHGVCGEHAEVEVVLPPSLVLFLDVGDAGEGEVTARIAEETQCALDDLVIGRDGGLTAVVERTTLEEARDFARMHGFRAAAFAARPGNGADGDISFRYEPLPPPAFRHRQLADPEEAEEAPPADSDSGEAPAAGPPAPPGEGAPGDVPARQDATTSGGPGEDTPPREFPAGALSAPPLWPVAARPVPEESAEEPATGDGGGDEPTDAAEGAVTWRTTRRNDPDTPTERAEVAHARHPAASGSAIFDASALPEIPFRPAGSRQESVQDTRAPDPPEASAEPEEEPDVPVSFRHAELVPDPVTEADDPDLTPMAEPEIDDADAPHVRPQRSDTGRVPAPPTAPLAAPGRKAGPAPVPSLTTPRVKPAKSEADALTIFGARGEPAPRARSFTMLHAAAALLAAGVLFAAYGLFQDDIAELEIVNLRDAATAALDPLTEAGGESADAVEPGAPLEPGEPGTELAALDPTVSVAPAPRPAEPPRDTVIEAPQSELATPVALPDPIKLDTPARLSAPVLPTRPDLATPGAFTPPPPPGTVFDMDVRGLVRPTEDGAMTPQGVMVHSGQPATLPPAAALAPSEGPDPTDGTVAGTQDDAALSPTEQEAVQTAPDIPRIRPPVRPEDAVAAPVVTALAAEEDTPRPLPRPASVADTVAASASDADPDFDALEREAQSRAAAAGADIASTAPRAAEPPPPEPEGRANVTVQPNMPTRASVAERATVQNALRLNRVNLIGVYGSASDRRALIRLPTGRYIKVKVGDRVDGGRVASIQNSRVEYVKGGRSFDLTLPSG